MLGAGNSDNVAYVCLKIISRALIVIASVRDCFRADHSFHERRVDGYFTAAEEAGDPLFSIAQETVDPDILQRQRCTDQKS